MDQAPAATTTPGSTSTTVVPEPSPEDTGPPEDIRVGKPADSERVTFIPEVLVLPGGGTAPVKPAVTKADGQLDVPENVAYVGWWDGSAKAGDAFGHTVIAGHVDSASGANGFFRRLERVKKGDVITLRSGPRRISYKITTVQKVPRRALADDSQAFVQTGEHRLVLITCTGAYIRSRGGYQKNLVVTGTPLGLATK